METLQRYAARQWPDASGGWRDYRIEEDDDGDTAEYGSGAEDDVACDRGRLLRPVAARRKFKSSPRRRMTVMLSVGRDLAQQFQQPFQKVRNTIKERFPSVGSLNSAASSSASSLASPPPMVLDGGTSLSPPLPASAVRTSPSSPSLLGAWTALRRGADGKSAADLSAIGSAAEFPVASGLPPATETTKIGRAQAKLNDVRSKFKSKHVDSQNLLKFDQLDMEDHD